MVSDRIHLEISNENLIQTGLNNEEMYYFMYWEVFV